MDADFKDKVINFYEIFGDHMLKLKTLSEKELRQEAFNAEDITYLKRFVNEAMASGPMISGWFLELFYDMEKGLEEDYLVVDVHTQPTDEGGNIVGNVLHVGTGDINLGVFCTGSPSDNYQQMAFVGPVMSYHEKVESNFKRLNDEEWGEFFGWNPEAKRPLRPGWVYQYLVNEEGITIDNTEEPNLEGAEYLGTGLETIQNTSDIAYLLAFPNPAEETTSLKFILNKDNDVKIEIFDAIGRSVFQENYKKLLAGEHSLSLQLANFNSGLYYVKMNAGKDKKLAKLIVN